MALATTIKKKFEPVCYMVGMSNVRSKTGKKGEWLLNRVLLRGFHLPFVWDALGISLGVYCLEDCDYIHRNCLT